MYSDNENQNVGNSNDSYNTKNGGSAVKLIVIIILLAILAAVAYFVLFKDKEDNTNVKVEMVNNPEKVSLSVEKKINVKVNGETYTGELEWNSSDEKIVEISKDSIAKAHKLGTVNVTVVYKKKDKEFEGKGKIITYIGEEEVDIEDVTVPEGDLILKSEGSYNLANDIQINPENAFITKKEYISSNPSVVTIDDDGKIEVVGEGESEITININDDYSKNIKVVVSNEIETSGFQKQPEKISFVDGESTKVVAEELKKLETSIEPLDASKGSLVWKSSDENILTVDGNGNVLGKSEGTATITVTCENGVSASIVVEVEVPNKEIEKIGFNQTGVFLDTNGKYQLTMQKDDTLVLTPVITPKEATNKELTFEVGDQSVLSITPNQDKQSASIIALKKGTTTVTVKSTNNIVETLTVIVESTSGGPSSSRRCYCNSSLSGCVWSSGSYDDYQQKQSRIPNANACNLYAQNHGLCFKDSSGEYLFGTFGNSSGYVYAAGAQSSSACEALNNSTDKKTATLSCSSAVVNGAGTCRYSTNVQPYTLRSASSSNTNIATVTVGGSNVTVSCKTKGTVTITGTPSNGLSDVSAQFECRDNTTFRVSCPRSVGVGETVVISSDSGVKCSTSSSNVTVSATSNGRCSVKGVNKGPATITVKSAENSEISKNCPITVNETKRDAEFKCNSNLVYNGTFLQVATCTNCDIDTGNPARGDANRDTQVRVTATAKRGHLFSDGTDKKEIECTIKKSN